VTVGRHRDRHAVPAQHAAEIHARVRGIVNGVHEHLPALRRARDGAIDGGRRRGDDEPRALEIGRAKPPPRDAYARAGDVRVHARRDYGDVRARLPQRGDLARRDRPAADDEHRPAGQFEKHGKELSMRHKKKKARGLGNANPRAFLKA
jgi:hypothetical protein